MARDTRLAAVFMAQLLAALAAGQDGGARVVLHTGPPESSEQEAAMTGERPVTFEVVDPVHPAEIGEPGTMAVWTASRPVTQAEMAAVHPPRRDWAVVLYSGDCEEHPGILCAMQAVGPCTLAETNGVVAAVSQHVPGFVPHRVALLDPADFLAAAPEPAGPRGARGDPTGDPPTG